MLLLLLRAYDNSSTQTEFHLVSKGSPLMKQEEFIKNTTSAIYVNDAGKDVGGGGDCVKIFYSPKCGRHPP